MNSLHPAQAYSTGSGLTTTRLAELTLEQRESLERRIRSRIAGEAHLKDALERLHDPKFGICIECHKDIAFVRLEEDPAALHCRDCAMLPVAAPSH